MRNPNLLLESEYQLDNSDFPQRFHRIIFNAIYNLFNSGSREIDSVSVDCYISNYKDQYKIFENNDGLEYLNEANELCNIELFKYNVKRIKKFTLLRKLETNNFSIKDIYDETNEIKLKEFDELELEDITNYYNKLLMEIEQDIANIESGCHVSEGIDELFEELEKEPIRGFNCGINALNHFLFGLRIKYYLFSAKSGFGKTRLQVYFSLWIGYHQNIPCLFISTEMTREEIISMMIAYISGIEERKIITQNLTPEEKKKEREAREKLKKSNIYILYLPDFSLEKIESSIKRYIFSKKIKFVFFDYIKESISMIEGMNKKVGKIDGWKALNLFSERLKVLNEKYKIGIVSATQLNKDESTSGSSAIPNSVDCWCKIRPATEKEMEKYGLKFETFTENEEIAVIEILKNRRGMKFLNIFLKTNLGKLQYEELMIVKNNNIIKVPKIDYDI
jgi:replicative DNA helicase